MDEVTAKTAEEFGFSAKSIRKHKYMYICRGEKETRILRKTSLSEAEIMMVYRFKKYLFDNGFTSTDKYFLSKNDVPYLKEGDNIYIMSDFRNASDISFESERDFLEAVSAVAAMHKAGRGFTGMSKTAVGLSIADSMRKDIRVLETARKNVRAKKHISDTDVLFMKSYENVYSKAKEALDAVESIDVFDNISVCHNALKEETISVSAGGKICITGMDMLSKDNYVRDLADITERYMRKHGEEYAGIESIVERYSSVYPIGKDGIRLLYAMLLFPKGYIKACKAMYSKNRNWVPIGTEQKFSLMAALQAENEKYIEPIKEF